MSLSLMKFRDVVFMALIEDTEGDSQAKLFNRTQRSVAWTALEGCGTRMLRYCGTMACVERLQLRRLRKMKAWIDIQRRSIISRS